MLTTGHVRIQWLAIHVLHTSRVTPYYSIWCSRCFIQHITLCHLYETRGLPLSKLPMEAQTIWRVASDTCNNIRIDWNFPVGSSYNSCNYRTYPSFHRIFIWKIEKLTKLCVYVLHIRRICRQVNLWSTHMQYGRYQRIAFSIHTYTE